MLGLSVQADGTTPDRFGGDAGSNTEGVFPDEARRCIVWVDDSVSGERILSTVQLRDVGMLSLHVQLTLLEESA